MTVSELKAARDLPLILDLDGTLCQQDTLHEGLRLALLRRPQEVFGLLAKAVSGDRLGLKERVWRATHAKDYPLLFNEELVALATAEKAKGRKVLVVTASRQDLAQELLAHFDFIDEVIGSGESANLKGSAKAALLRDRFPEGFVYAGNEDTDLPVWEAASGAILVNGRPGTRERLQRLHPDHLELAARENALIALLRALRPAQWAKNLLVFVPLVLSGQATDFSSQMAALLGFAALCALSSSAYLLNDLLDLEADRNHWSKLNRPLASGALPLWAGALFAPLLALLGLAIGLVLGWPAEALLACYLLLTLAYSLKLKRIPMLDVFCLAVLFTLRLIFGGEVVSGVVSEWLFAFSLLFFTSLAASKRVVELQRVASQEAETSEKPQQVMGRGYRISDLLPLQGLSYGAGVGSLIVMMIYIIDDAAERAQFSLPEALWALPAVLFLWHSRIWLLVARDELHDDPVSFAVKDRLSLAALALIGAAVLIALYL